ncbi:MAG: hypothetical protein U1E45_02325 [Geminicoccaceae bacterium]
MILRLLLTLPVCLTLATAAGAADVCAPKILRPLAGDTESQARAVNAAGQAVGWSKGPRGVRAVFWDAAGRPHVLSPLPGDTIARAYGLNSDGVVVGDSEGATFNAVVWRLDRKPRRLAFPSGHEQGHARSINDKGLIAGWSLDRTDGKGPAGGQALHGVVWRGASVLRDLAPLAGDLETLALDINAKGETVGVSYGRDGRETAVLWSSDGTPTALPQLAKRNTGVAFAINAGGEAAGVSGRPAWAIPTAWTPAAEALPEPTGVTRSLGLDNDGAGEAAGYGQGTGGSHVALFWDRDGRVHVLPPLAGDVDTEAFGIAAGPLVAGHSLGARGVKGVLWRVAASCR